MNPDNTVKMICILDVCFYGLSGCFTDLAGAFCLVLANVSLQKLPNEPQVESTLDTLLSSLSSCIRSGDWLYQMVQTGATCLFGFCT